MHYIFVLLLLVGISEAAQPAPVYRAGPTVLGSPPNKPNQSPQPAVQVAEERESQVYPTNPDTKALNPGSGVGGVQGQPVQGAKGPGQNGNEQLFQVVYFPGGTHPGQQPQTSSSLYPMSYQAQQPGAPAATSGTNFFNSIPWIDVLVAASSVGLVAAGSYMMYPYVISMKGRAMRELNMDDAATLADRVLKAIQKYSERNNSRE